MYMNGSYIEIYSMDHYPKLWKRSELIKIVSRSCSHRFQLLPPPPNLGNASLDGCKVNQRSQN
jgi:hypothetical protein